MRLEIQKVALADRRIGHREIVRHPGGVAVVSELPDGRFIFIRQYRKPVEQDLLELPAGCIEKGETPEECAQREIREETGYGICRLRRLGTVFSSPGFCDEALWLGHALLAETPGAPQPDADEALTLVIMTRAAAEAAMHDGRICDAKTLAAWWLFSRPAPVK